MPDDIVPNEPVPPGIGPSEGGGLIQRRRYPLAIVGLIIISPLLLILVIYILRLVFA